MNSFHYGKSREKIVIGELLRHNLDVYLPIVDDRGIDCVIRIAEENYIELQIKSSSNKIKNKGSAGLFAGLKIPVPRTSYFFLFHVAEAGDNGTYWLFPSIDIDKFAKNKNVSNVYLYSHGYDIQLTGNDQKKGGVYPKPQFSEYEVDFDSVDCFEMLFKR
ncbi:hypothetical protein JT359_06685 [Candidatus Poribacteria bacterium]|nr:hypothetical protein [Candidatus Poribacteria bacterium]